MTHPFGVTKGEMILCSRVSAASCQQLSQPELQDAAVEHKLVLNISCSKLGRRKCVFLITVTFHRG